MASGPESQLIDAELLLAIPDCLCFRLEGGTKEWMDGGELRVLQSHVQDEQVMVLMMETFNLALSRNVPCLRVAPLNYVFPSSQCFYGLQLPASTAPETLEVFEEFLKEQTAYRVGNVHKELSELHESESRIAESKHAGGVAAGGASLSSTTALSSKAESMSGPAVHSPITAAAAQSPNSGSNITSPAPSSLPSVISAIHEDDAIRLSLAQDALSSSMRPQPAADAQPVGAAATSGGSGDTAACSIAGPALPLARPVTEPALSADAAPQPIMGRPPSSYFTNLYSRLPALPRFWRRAPPTPGGGSDVNGVQDSLGHLTVEGAAAGPAGNDPSPMDTTGSPASVSVSSGSVTQSSTAMVVSPGASGSVGTALVPASAVIGVTAIVPVEQKSPEDEIVLRVADVNAYELHSDGTKSLQAAGLLTVTTRLVKRSPVYVLRVLGADGRPGWELELLPQVPCLRVCDNNYVFVTAAKTFGLVLPDSATEVVVEVLEIVLNEHSAFRVGQKRVPMSAMPDRPDRVVVLGNKTAVGILDGSQRLATKVVAGAQSLGEHVRSGSQYLKARIKPADQPVQLSAVTKTRVHSAKMVSGAAVKVSKALVTGAVATAASLSVQVSDAAAKTRLGQKLREEGGPRAQSAKSVAKASLHALWTLYDAVEHAGLMLLGDVHKATVDVIGHKYGDDAGSTADAGIGAVVDVGTAAINMRRVGVRALARTTAGYAAADILSDEEERKANRAARPVIDPASTMQAAVVMGQVAGAVNSAAGTHPLAGIARGAGSAISSAISYAAAAAAGATGAAGAPGSSGAQLQPVTVRDITDDAPASRPAQPRNAAAQSHDMELD